MFFSELFELPCESLNLLKGDRLVHCSVENVAVLCKNHHESHKFELARLKKKKKKKKKKKEIWLSGDILVWYFCDAF